MSNSGKFLNPTNIIKKVFDETNDSIRVSSPGISEIIIDAASGDNIAIKNSDGSDINSSTPLPVTFIENTYNNIYSFNNITAVPMGVETSIISYIVPNGKNANLIFSEMSGTNVATFNLYLGASLINKKRTFFGDLNNTMEFKNKGFYLTSGQVITLKVIHTRPDTGEFEANLQIKESV